ncbi:MAG TPA: YdcF family protein [Candidatus Paceibacterota bacterium]|nr:YdcF family protein [Verrucomicrobiota bacterium]HSA10805.1 YdcF family protein [Candidatus Paceibacterota bacterium]
MEPNEACWGLLRRRQCLVPTWRGWLVLALNVAVLGCIVICGAHRFLAVTEPAPGGVLVVEGWSPDIVLRMAVAEFRQNHYTKLCVTGLPVEQGTLLTDYTNYAHVGVAVLLKLGLSTNEVQALPCTDVQRDRTYNTAVCLKHWLREQGLVRTRVNLITVGPHARRSRLVFEKALGRGVTVGIQAAPVIGYDPARWWQSSAGVRHVTGELIAYAYARLLFHPPAE